VPVWLMQTVVSSFDFEAWDDVVHATAQVGVPELEALIVETEARGLPDYLTLYCVSTIRIRLGQVEVAELELEANDHPLCQGLWMRTIESSHRKQATERAIQLPDFPPGAAASEIHDEAERRAVKAGWLLWSLGKAGLHLLKQDTSHAQALYAQSNLLAVELKWPSLELFCQMQLALVGRQRGGLERFNKFAQVSNRDLLDKYHQGQCAEFLGMIRYPEARAAAREISSETERNIWLTLINLLEEKPFDPSILYEVEKYKGNQSYILCMVVIHIRQGVLDFMKLDMKGAQHNAEIVLKATYDVQFEWDYHDMIANVCRVHANLLLAEYQAALSLCMRYHRKSLAMPRDINRSWWLSVCYIKTYFYGSDLENDPQYTREQAVADWFVWYAALPKDVSAKYSTYLLGNASNTYKILLDVFAKFQAAGYEMPSEIEKSMAFMVQSYGESKVLMITRERAFVGTGPAFGYQGSRSGLEDVVQIMEERMSNTALRGDYTYVKRHTKWVEENHANLPVVWGWRVDDFIDRLDLKEVYTLMMGLYRQYF